VPQPLLPILGIIATRPQQKMAESSYLPQPNRKYAQIARRVGVLTMDVKIMCADGDLSVAMIH
jgi:hypothetical protein